MGNINNTKHALFESNFLVLGCHKGRKNAKNDTKGRWGGGIPKIIKNDGDNVIGVPYLHQFVIKVDG